jgi:quercetin dioxygenase-like cupin family protein
VALRFSPAVLLFVGLAALAPGLARGDQGVRDQGVRVETLVRSDRSWNGTRLPALRAEQPEVSILRITVPAGVSLQRHFHPVINAGVLLQGRLRVEADDGATKLVEAGDALIEMVNTVHRGVSIGPDSAVILVVYVGQKGQPLTVPVSP